MSTQDPKAGQTAGASQSLDAAVHSDGGACSSLRGTPRPSVEQEVELASCKEPNAVPSCSPQADPEADGSRQRPPESSPDLKGWRRPASGLSLPEVHSSVSVPSGAGTWHLKAAAFAGVGFMVAVGYMDPGNWATDLSAGSEFGYMLLFAVLVSSLAAMFLQSLSLKLGVVAERDLAQGCRDAYPRWLVYILWATAEVAIAATDLAEVIGSATALYLLFGLPLWAGVLITVADVLLILAFGTHNVRLLELLVFMLIATIVVCFLYELVQAKPNWGQVGKGFIPRKELITNSSVLYNAIGILGATVMPHNLYLHSSIIQTRNYPRTPAGKKMALRFGLLDSTVSLTAAFFVNAAILILAGAAFFYGTGHGAVAYISDAYHLIAPALGSQGARILFGVALLASGQNSTITGTLAGQIVLEGFLEVKIPPWARRLATRLVSIIPAAIVAGVAGNKGAGKLLVLSQVILSLTLVFAVAPLAHFTSSRAKMGVHVNSWATTAIAWLLTLIIALLNGYLIVESIVKDEFGSTNSV